jgi:hypothetical protein
MRLKVDGDFIYAEDGTIVAVVTDHCSDELKREIEFGSEALPIVREFISNTNSGSLRPRTTVKRFETLLNKYELTT